MSRYRVSHSLLHSSALLLAVSAPLLGASAFAQQAAQVERPAAAAETEAASNQAVDIITVTGYRLSRLQALQEQRDAINRKDVVTADRVGQLPDQNIADAVSRLPGVSLLGDVGEGRFVSVRGINPNLNNVTVNGTSIASSGIRNLAGRDSVSGNAVPLDVISSSQVGSIEVVKSVTPDMDANAIGGSVNLRTVSAFDYDERTVFGSVSAGQARLAGETIYDGDIAFADRFGAERNLAVVLSSNFSRRPYRMEALQVVWRPTPFSEGRLLPQQQELLPEFSVRERRGFAANIEYRPNAESEYYLRTTLNEFKEDLERQESTFTTTNRQGRFVSDRVIVYDRVRADVDASSQKTDQTQFSMTAGFERTFGTVTVESSLNYSYGAYDNPNMNEARFRNGNIQTSGMEIDFNGFIHRVDLGTNNLADPNNYAFERWTESDFRVRSELLSPRLDLTWDAGPLWGSDHATFRTGVKYHRSNRDQRADVIRYSGGSLRLSDIPQVVVTPGSTNRGDVKPFDLDPDTLFGFLRANLQLLNPNVNFSRNRSARNTFSVDENIFSAYVMGTLQYGPLTALAGVRYERTDATLRGLEHQLQNGQPGPITENVSDFAYNHLFPNLQLRYEITPQLLVRGAFTMTIARPEYENAAPSSVLNVQFSAQLDPEFPFEGSNTIGNPELQPYESTNFDVGVEYYFDTGAMLMASLFHKRIDNPIYPFSNEFNRIERNGFAFDRLVENSTANADEATVQGIELGAFIPFTFLPAPFDNFGVDGNIAFISSDVDVPGRPESLPFFEQPDRVSNAALFYDDERFAFRIAYSHQTASLRELRNGPEDHFYRSDYGQLDAQVTYRLTDAFTLFVNGQNMTDQAQNTFSGIPSQIRYSRLTGANYRAGIRARF